MIDLPRGSGEVCLRGAAGAEGIWCGMIDLPRGSGEVCLRGAAGAEGI